MQTYKKTQNKIKKQSFLYRKNDDIYKINGLHYYKIHLNIIIKHFH